MIYVIEDVRNEFKVKLTDIFNFYMRGYPNIPDEYLYKE